MTKKKITVINGLEIDSIPSGVVVSWYGDKANVPSGWAICDGTNGTPDLRDRFIVGAGNSYSLKDTGGSDKVSLTGDEVSSHDHKITCSSAGGHSHLVSRNVDLHSTDPGGGGVDTVSNYDGSNTYTTSTAGEHTHEITISSNASGNLPHENRPPYYALYFIMKL